MTSKEVLPCSNREQELLYRIRNLSPNSQVVLSYLYTTLGRPVGKNELHAVLVYEEGGVIGNFDEYLKPLVSGKFINQEPVAGIGNAFAFASGVRELLEGVVDKGHLAYKEPPPEEQVGYYVASQLTFKHGIVSSGAGNNSTSAKSVIEQCGSLGIQSVNDIHFALSRARISGMKIEKAGKDASLKLAPDDIKTRYRTLLTFYKLAIIFDCDPKDKDDYPYQLQQEIKQLKKKFNIL